MTQNIQGNYYDKHNSKNPVVKILMKNFHAVLNKTIKATGAKTIIDAGCGEGHTTKIIKDANPEISIEGIEIGRETAEKARALNPGIKFEEGTIYEIKRSNESYDLAISTEVLEHLEEPLKGLNELKRVSKKFVLVTVPNEPLWRITNIARLSYIKQFGNTPGHINHWSKRKLKKFLEPHFKNIKIKKALLWLVALCEKN
jgi:2-polyprenyl-3-methyl-5-hydroxy-6-metoxy-1,4-benzoquinol methylase